MHVFARKCMTGISLGSFLFHPYPQEKKTQQPFFEMTQIHHAEFSKNVKFLRDLLRNRGNITIQNLRFLQRNIWQAGSVIYYVFARKCMTGISFGSFLFHPYPQEKKTQQPFFEMTQIHHAEFSKNVKFLRDLLRNRGNITIQKLRFLQRNIWQAGSVIYSR